jgi:LuxR family transcriptional regulator, maltose regulon positive regulatory protein
MIVHQDAGLPLLPTKLAVPGLRSGVVQRSQLLDQLAAAAKLPVTLIAAPAGFGKTTLLAQWVSGLRSARHGWISLDTGDGDTARFWSYIFAALRGACPGLRADVLKDAGSPRPLLPTAVPAQLIVELAQVDQDVVLVLDDYHLAENAELDTGLAFLIDHLPPRLHLVLGTRTDPALPLSRLRARGELLELRAAELRCTTEEAARFCSQTMGLELTPASVALLETRTEGWWAGLQLAALSLRDRPDPDRFLGAFAGSHRYVLDYLIEEVLHQQSALRQAFLLRTAVLDRLNGPLCDAVTGGRDGQAQLERLEHDNLFLVPLDAERGWYRYHHLLRDVLSHQLRRTEPELMPELHRRASAWCVDHGLREEAVEHALSAGEWDGAAGLIEDWMEPLRMRGGYGTLYRWLGALPEAVRARHPLISYQYGLALVRRARADEAEGASRALDAAERSATTTHDAALLGAVARARLSLAIQRGAIDEAVACGERAVAAIPSTEWQLRVEALATLGRAWALRGEPIAAAAVVLEAQQQLRAEADAELRCLVLNASAHRHLAAGQLHRAAADARQARRVAGSRPSLEGAHAAVRLSEIYREWNRLRDAETMLEEAHNVAVRAGQAAYQFPLSIAIIHLKLARVDLDGALAAVERAQEIAGAWDNRMVVRGLASDEAWVQLLRGDRGAVRRWATDADLDRPSLCYLADDRVVEMLVRAWIALGSPERAEALFELRREAVSTAGRTGHLIALDALHALALEAQGQREAALGALEPALQRAEPDGYIRTFVREGAPMQALLRDALVHRIHADYVGQLLRAFGKLGAPAVGLLTEREREVLALLAKGRSNREVAEELVISPETVKVHVGRILHKLGAHSRAQALLRARELDLI